MFYYKSAQMLPEISQEPYHTPPSLRPPSNFIPFIWFAFWGYKSLGKSAWQDSLLPPPLFFSLLFLQKQPAKLMHWGGGFCEGFFFFFNSLGILDIYPHTLLLSKHAASSTSLKGLIKIHREKRGEDNKTSLALDKTISDLWIESQESMWDI